jgi:hypothetical protein
MFQKMYGTRIYPTTTDRETRSENAWSGSRSRVRGANLVLGCLCSTVACLAIAPVGDRKLLFEQYDVKLRSYQDRLPAFCLSVLPSVFGMAVLLIAYKAVSVLKSTISS